MDAPDGVVRSGNRILANESLKLDVVRSHHQSGDLLAQLGSSPGAPDLQISNAFSSPSSPPTLKSSRSPPTPRPRRC
ncbi:hypothetical protein DFJ73DRAFT_788648 [Zopfochytrium polystomum]|nr:hypothetical protein DFJ73DRAFT_788648 [Zopfochytrium polystomum]